MSSRDRGDLERAGLARDNGRRTAFGRTLRSGRLVDTVVNTALWQADGDRGRDADGRRTCNIAWCRQHHCALAAISASGPTLRGAMIMRHRTGCLPATGVRTFLQICAVMMKVRRIGNSDSGKGFGSCDRSRRHCVMKRRRAGDNRTHGCMQEAADQCQTNQNCDSFQGRYSVYRLVLDRGYRLEQSRSIDHIEFVGVATEFTGHFDFTPFLQDRVDFGLSEHAQHIGNTLPGA